MAVTKMKMIAYKDGSFRQRVSDYTVMLNPEALKIDRQTVYTKKQAINSSASSDKYESSPGATLNFDLVLDCTGIVDPKRTDLPEEIKTLQKVIYDYNGEIHQPNYVKVAWGKDLNFQGLLTSYNINYTLFKSNGIALRAKVSLSFKAFEAREEVVKKEKKASPDLTHLVEVIQGDSLPQLSEKYWGSPSYYIQAAKFNGLNKFRELQAGSTLVFPPLVTES